MKRFFHFFRIAPLIVALSLAASVRCIVEKDVEKTSDAWSEIYAAIEFKAKECGNRPGYLLIVPSKPPSYGTRLCSLTIVRQTCPFTDYPVFCLEMYRVDLPGIGP